MFSVSPGTPGRMQQMPRMMSCTSTPAWDASASLSILKLANQRQDVSITLAPIIGPTPQVDGISDTPQGYTANQKVLKLNMRGAFFIAALKEMELSDRHRGQRHSGLRRRCLWSSCLCGSG